MLFNSFQFLWLFPIIFVAYWGCAGFFKGRQQRLVGNCLLLVISYALYIQWKPVFALLLLGITAVTYGAALAIERQKAYGRKRYIVASGVFLALLPLLTFKYYNFLNDTLTDILHSVNIETGLPGLNWAIPMGISFYTFMAVGYLFDVYYQRIKAEHNWWNYMLFVSFFPQIASGPISKAKDLLPQIKAERTFCHGKAVEGMKLLLWGLFLKVCLADRLGLFINQAVGNYAHQSGVTNILIAVFYSFQIYGDFAGYSYMAIGVGRLLGFDLINNFRRPYLSVSVTDFWRRWHISLSMWLKDYVYIPLGGSRCSKVRNYWNIFVTFLISGIWHGANWTFIVWGVMHGLFQVVEKAFGWQKCESRSPIVKAFRILTTFVLVMLAWVIFRMPTLSDGIGLIANMGNPGGLDMGYVNIVWFTLVAMFLPAVVAKDVCEEFFPNISLLNNKRRIVRWATYLLLASAILSCGVLDGGQFIYVSF